MPPSSDGFSLRISAECGMTRAAPGRPSRRSRAWTRPSSRDSRRGTSTRRSRRTRALRRRWGQPRDEGVPRHRAERPGSPPGPRGRGPPGVTSPALERDARGGRPSAGSRLGRCHPARSGRRAGGGHGDRVAAPPARAVAAVEPGEGRCPAVLTCLDRVVSDRQAGDLQAPGRALDAHQPRDCPRRPEVAGDRLPGGSARCARRAHRTGSLDRPGAVVGAPRGALRARPGSMAAVMRPHAPGADPGASLERQSASRAAGIAGADPAGRVGSAGRRRVGGRRGATRQRERRRCRRPLAATRSRRPLAATVAATRVYVRRSRAPPPARPRTGPGWPT